MAILVTGGLGYIGSHTVVQLQESGYDVVIVDNLVNSKKSVLKRIKQITGVLPTFYEFDIRDKKKLSLIFNSHNITDVIHFAALKAINESIENPLDFYKNNLDSTLVLLDVMLENNVKNLVFSSSATVYGDDYTPPYDETMKEVKSNTPYGTSKVMNEWILKDVQYANPEMNIVVLRYFNPIGAHPSGLIGEDPEGEPKNLMPYISQVASGQLSVLSIYGDDYETPDGTGVRGYLHVMDLADGHIAALKKIESNPGYVVYNLGTLEGTSVLELIHAFEQANNIKINWQIKNRRDGDVAISYANVEKANKELNWYTKRTIVDACRDSWKWQNYSKDKPNI